jgi:hypothetical protein
VAPGRSVEPLPDVGKMVPIVLDAIARPVMRLRNKPTEVLAIMVGRDSAAPLRMLIARFS